MKIKEGYKRCPRCGGIGYVEENIIVNNGIRLFGKHEKVKMRCSLCNGEKVIKMIRYGK